MRLFIALFCLLFWLSLTLAPQAAHAGKKALVIIDMQDHFVGANAGVAPNLESMKILNDEQTSMIELARSKSIPIMIVAYGGDGPVSEHILKSVEGYANVATVVKDSDGLFDDPNSAALARAQLAAWGTTDLIVMGANGGYCVLQTIRGALTNGYHVWSFKNGIIDFNTQPFQYPYPYLAADGGGWDMSRQLINASQAFREFAQPVQTVNFRRMPRIRGH